MRVISSDLAGVCYSPSLLLVNVTLLESNQPKSTNKVSGVSNFPLVSRFSKYHSQANLRVFHHING